MDPLDLMRLALRWAHSLAAVAWLGGGLFYLLTRPEVGAAALRELFRTAVAVFLATGVILALDRLTQPQLPALSPPLLALKMGLSVALFAFVATRPARPHESPSEGSDRARQPMLVVLGAGALIYLLAIALKLLYERGLAEMSSQPSAISLPLWLATQLGL